jgi:hypothetical protein
MQIGNLIFINLLNKHGQRTQCISMTDQQHGFATGDAQDNDVVPVRQQPSLRHFQTFSPANPSGTHDDNVPHDEVKQVHPATEGRYHDSSSASDKRFSGQSVEWLHLCSFPEAHRNDVHLTAMICPPVTTIDSALPLSARANELPGSERMCRLHL